MSTIDEGVNSPVDGDPAAVVPAAVEPAAADTDVVGRADAVSTTAPAAPAHPVAPVPVPLFDDPAAEERWRARYSTVRVSLPTPARHHQDRALYVSNQTGRFELYCWDVATDRRLQATDRPDGTIVGTLSANGMGTWWFDDTAGDEFGKWMAQPFGAAPGSAGEAIPGVAPGFPAGLEVGRDVVLAGFTDDDGTRVHLARSGREVQVVYRNEADGAVGALSTDESLWVLEHTERGDSRYPALRAHAIEDGAVVAELDDSPGRGLSAVDFSPVAGDQRLLVGHERRGRDELLVWDIGATGTDGRDAVWELPIDLPGDVTGRFTRDAAAVLVVHQHHGRSTLHHFDLSTGTLVDVPVEVGSIDGILPRDDGTVWLRGSSAARAAALESITLTPIGAVSHPDTSAATRPIAETRSTPLALTPDMLPPGSEPVVDVWVDGPGGRIHALLAVPAGSPVPQLDGFSNVPLRSVFLLHGGPDAADDDSFDAERALWLDAGFAVVQVNYRGSSGYGSQWRDALTERVGHTELADVAAVQDFLLSRGVVAGESCVVAGASWGGFLTLLALGSQPSRWAAGVAGVPVADYPVAYRQEMEALRAYDRALFGGSPDDVPEKYHDSSPLTWIDGVTVPVLVLAGANDPRCPLGQIENYLDALQATGKTYAVYSFDAGHGSMVVEERLRQAAVEVAFALDVIGRVG